MNINSYTPILFTLLTTLSILLTGISFLFWATKVRTYLLLSQAIYFLSDIFLYSIILLNISHNIHISHISFLVHIEKNIDIILLWIYIIKIFLIINCIYNYMTRLHRS